MIATNKAKAVSNELQVLHAIGVTGWLSATQIAKWVWGCKNPHSARVSADKVLKRLLERGDLKRRECSLLMCVYILTKTGALRANEGMSHDFFRHGYDLSQLDTARQRPAVDYLIKQHHEGNLVMGIAGLRKVIELGLGEVGLKNADGLVVDSRTGEFKAILVIRNTHPELVKKAIRIKKAAGGLELIGSEGLVKFFRKQTRG
jgi:hypothetical protein